jgi:DNA-binding protein H-NS
MATAKKMTLAAVEAQIAKLQKEAQALRAAEVGGVIARIKDAIAHYGITADDLGLGTARAASKAARKSISKAPEAPKAAKPAASKKAAQPKKAASAAPKTIGVAKYGDGQGKTWTGRGTRPKWFVAALAAGKTADDLLLSKA